MIGIIGIHCCWAEQFPDGTIYLLIEIVMWYCWHQEGLYTIPAEKKGKKKVYTYQATLGATFIDRQLFTYLGSKHLILPSLVTEFDKLCT